MEARTQAFLEPRQRHRARVPLTNRLPSLSLLNSLHTGVALPPVLSLQSHCWKVYSFGVLVTTYMLVENVYPSSVDLPNAKFF
jgi:hypothetical protein